MMNNCMFKQRDGFFSILQIMLLFFPLYGTQDILDDLSPSTPGGLMDLSDLTAGLENTAGGKSYIILIFLICSRGIQRGPLNCHWSF